MSLRPIGQTIPTIIISSYKALPIIVRDYIIMFFNNNRFLTFNTSYIFLTIR